MLFIKSVKTRIEYFSLKKKKKERLGKDLPQMWIIFLNKSWKNGSVAVYNYMYSNSNHLKGSAKLPKKL